ncbi:energy-coupling factor transporter transmembrane component T family protein [Caloramator proteoclasticus]|uniref:Cobalt/nickel transport system permease protein n=1 Tax=Caloramator proteoclasticus DSM 10124 TaxID=1121262 RepID=A0A1M4Y3R4_9CLOT|nr:energy-coupling factor transporter transmembrane component T [Caloramator proteoclasticus]SHF00329.1 cobalt/nickel transport system permease protein [Caloramator proteoclasticus DSM 10124]
MDWLKEKDEFEFEIKNESFIEKTLSSLLSLISKIRRFDNRDRGIYKIHEAFKIYFTLINIILLSLSFNKFYIMLNASYVILLIIFLDDKDVLKILNMLLLVFIFSSLIIGPSLFFGNKNALLVIVKITISIALTMVMSITSNWHNIISAFRLIKVPNIVLFIFDSAIRFIYLLSERAYAILCSLKIRSVGHIKKPYSTLSQIMYNLFVTSIDMSFKVDEALECRCFSGEFKYSIYKKVGKFEILYSIINLIIIAGFFILS